MLESMNIEDDGNVIEYGSTSKCLNRLGDAVKCVHYTYSVHISITDMKLEVEDV